MNKATAPAACFRPSRAVICLLLMPERRNLKTALQPQLVVCRYCHILRPRLAIFVTVSHTYNIVAALTCFLQRTHHLSE